MENREQPAVVETSTPPGRSETFGYRVERCHIQHWIAPPEEVLPLLTLERENEWFADFQPRALFAGETSGGQGSVFLTGPQGDPVIWTTTLYDSAARRVEYFRVHPATHAVQIQIRLEPEGDRGTAAETRYAYTALTAVGRVEVEEFTEEAYRRQMLEWETTLNHYLATAERREP